MKRRLRGLLVVLSMVSSSTAAHAEDVANDCADAAERGQDLRDRAELLEARRAFLSCARDACPNEVAKACRQWLVDVEARRPTISLQVVDVASRDRPDAKVTIDGADTDAHATGRAVAIDPGPHEIRATLGSRTMIERFVARERESARAVRIVIDDRPIAPVTASSPVVPSGNHGPPVATWILGGVGALGLGTFAVLGLDATASTRHLEDTCARPCSDPRIDTNRREFLMADVGLAVGIVAVAAGAYLWFRDARHTRPVGH